MTPGPGARLVIVGDGETAELAHEHFSLDSPYAVAGFAVERAFLRAPELCGLPVVALEEMEARFPPGAHEAFVAVSSTRLNRVRRRLFRAAKAKGYRCASYVSSRASVSPSAVLGENAFVFEGCVLERRGRVADAVTIWSGSVVAHGTAIDEAAFLAPRAAVAGFCTIGRGAFLGVNCSVADRIAIAPDTVVGAGAVVIRDTEPGKVYVGNPARPLAKDAYASMGVPEAER
ncbi:MAG TPA: acetyltransferase [Planctomycetota bacterium]|nr:acetyltransferase [Planctomycetota bacterium]